MSCWNRSYGLCHFHTKKKASFGVTLTMEFYSNLMRHDLWRQQSTCIQAILIPTQILPTSKMCLWHPIILLTSLFRIFKILLPGILFSEQSPCSEKWNNLHPLSRSNQGVSKTQLISHLWSLVGFNIARVMMTKISRPVSAFRSSNESSLKWVE